MSGFPRRGESLRRRVADLQLSLGADRPILSVLVANNGNAASKFIRSVRTWSEVTD